MKQTLLKLLFLISISIGTAQTKNFIDLPYIEASGVSDTLVLPDKIFLKIEITERDSKGKVSVEEFENKMIDFFKSSNIDIKKQLSVSDVSSNFKRYFLKQKDILKAKEYILEVANAKEVAKVIVGLEDIGISNVTLDRTEYSKQEELLLILKTKAIQKAKYEATTLSKALNQKIGEAIHISNTTASNNYNGVKLQEVVVVGYSGKSNYEPNDIEIQKMNFIAGVNVKFKLL